jgi:hypothetical protein
MKASIGALAKCVQRVSASPSPTIVNFSSIHPSMETNGIFIRYEDYRLGWQASSVIVLYKTAIYQDAKEGMLRSTY